MGANATTFVPAYVAGEVLTAADLSVTNSGIPVFADATARDAAFGGTGEKVLAEGQYAYLESTNVTQFYDGSSWQNINSGGLVRVGGGTLSGAATTISNIFSATYDAYKIVFTNLSFSATGWATFKFGASTTGYYAGGPSVLYSSTTDNNYNLNNAALITNFVYSASTTGSTIMEVQNPFLTVRTGFQFPNMQFATNATGGYFSGFLNDATSYTAFTITAPSGTLTGTVNVYGYALS